jgi:hypothetical protein
VCPADRRILNTTVEYSNVVTNMGTLSELAKEARTERFYSSTSATKDEPFIFNPHHQLFNQTQKMLPLAGL